MISIGDIRDVIKAFLDAKKWWQSRNKQSVADRFFKLFESHGVHRNQIPRFIGHNLVLADVQDAASLTLKLTEALLDDVCDRFAVRREWLDGVEDRMYRRYDFYTKPGEFSEFVKALRVRNPDRILEGVLIWPAEMHFDSPAVIVMQEPIGYVGDKMIYRYFLCNNWVPAYWKSRAYITACVASAWKQRVYVHGLRVPSAEIKRLATGTVMLSCLSEIWWDATPQRWPAEDLALKPGIYLDGVDAEDKNFGVRSALKLWLDLDSEGFMDAGIEYAQVRQNFEAELEKQS